MIPAPCKTHYAYLDLEIGANDQIYRLGLVSPRGEWDVTLKNAQPIQTELLHFQHRGGVVCGHNIRQFDCPYLSRQWPDLAHLQVIDTLELSVLALPLQPSHKLQKDYKLSEYTSNHPLEDARATQQLLPHLLETLSTQPESLQAAYRWLLSSGQTTSDRAYQQLFTDWQLSLAPVALNELPPAAIAEMSATALAKVWATIPELNFSDRLGLAALLAWNYARNTQQSPQSPSPWLTHQANFGSLRATLFPLLTAGFTYQAYLRAFGVDQFRAHQEAAVQAIIAGQNPLILMPTGGGKSLCYQLPAWMFAQRQQGLTVCISPLQALMEDQVADLETVGLTFATFINSTLATEERSQRLQQVRDGWKSLLYISPEQLRSLSIRALLRDRLPVLWVIDEAHCISQWGHDFRPDYCYLPKFIQTLYQDSSHPLPRLALLTATATTAVQADIQALFAAHELPIQQEIRGEIQRKNLTFEVHTIHQANKDKLLRSLLAPFHPKQGNANGCALIYTTTRKEAERLAAMLNTEQEDTQFAARYYHGRLNREEKTEVLTAFKEKRLNIVTATCAFGMGINRADVRLVVHHTLSSSLESYIQEAGRAGRDRQPATCTLLFNEQDADTIFFLKSLNQLSVLELRSLFKSVRKLRDRTLKTNKSDWFWATPEELFQASQLDKNFASEDEQRDTKIKVALHYLEQFELLERAENQSTLIQFSLLQSSPLKAYQQLEQYSRKHNFSEQQTEQFRRLIHAMFLAAARPHPPNTHFPLERISDDSGIPIHELTSRIHELQQASICTAKIPIQLSLSKGVKGDARTQLQRIRLLEQEFFEELLPLMGETNQTQINLRGMATRLAEQRPDLKDISTTNLLNILAGWKTLKWVDWQPLGNNLVRLQNLDATEWLERHQYLSKIILKVIYRDIDQGSSTKQQGSQLLVSYDFSELLDKIQQYTKPQTWNEIEIKSILFWLHQHKIIRLTEGLSLFHQSFRLRTLLTKQQTDKRIDAIDRRYHQVQKRYEEQARRTHMMVEYGRHENEHHRKQFVQDYFSLPPEEFANAYPHLVSDAVKRPVTQADYDRIMLPLNPDQTAIVEATDPAMVVIAGPGSGKTRTIVHRIAYLVKVKRINPDRILVLAYNRNAIQSLRLRLQDLIGSLAFYLRVYTFHGLALALLGRTLSTNAASSKIDFEQLLKAAIALLASANNPDNLDNQAQVTQILGNIEYIFVDEYQDVNEDAYQLIKHIAELNKTQDDSRSTQMNLCVIGDDDQTINEFAGARVHYIQEAELDRTYRAKRYLLTENYRSTEAIITAANTLIQHNQNRCKRTAEEQVRINQERQGDTGPAVRAFKFANPASQAGWVCEQVQAWLDGGVAAAEIAILAHQWKRLSPVRSLLDQAKIPTCVLKNDGIPLLRNWVAYCLMEKLTEAGFKRILTANESVRDRFLTLFHHWNRWETEPTVQTLLNIAASLDAERQCDDPNEDSAISADNILTTLFEFNQTGAGFTQANAIAVTSCHGAKGLEFRKVIVLTDGFTIQTNQVEAERRLLYTAMTRAQEELILCGTQGNPLVHETGVPVTRMGDRSLALPQQMLYLDFTPKEVHLGHAATQRQQALIQSLHEGEAIELRANQFQGWTVYTQEGQAIGALSRSGTDTLRQQGIVPHQFQFQAHEVTIRSLYHHLKWDEVTGQLVEDWVVVIPQIRVCR